ncbi:MAG: hypothetical protein OES38_10890 [Gammaproteobacteria bacterium]|nr:hypothetical protein [Gammaproteobacteria bacterium]
METTTQSSTEEQSRSEATAAEGLDDAVVNEVRVEEPQIEQPEEEPAVANAEARRARVKAGLEKSSAQVLDGAKLVTGVVKGERKFDTELPFVWLLRVSAIVIAVLAPFAPVVATSISGVLGYIADVVVNLAAAFAVFAASNLVDVIYDIRDQLDSKD